MAAYSQATSIAAYKQVATRGLISDSDPHQLISLLMDGALERLRLGKACISNGQITAKAAALHRVVEIIDELRMSLNHSVGGEMAANMARLYDYMARRILAANLGNDAQALDEVIGLLGQIRGAWNAIPAQYRSARQG